MSEISKEKYLKEIVSNKIVNKNEILNNLVELYNNSERNENLELLSLIMEYLWLLNDEKCFKTVKCDIKKDNLIEYNFIERMSLYNSIKVNGI